MLRSDWRFILAGIIGLGLTLSSYGYYEVDKATRPHHASENQNPARQAPPKPTSSGNQTKAEAYDPNCPKPKDQGDSDLCAQWSAVEAVKESNRLVRVGIKGEDGELVAHLGDNTAGIWPLAGFFVEVDHSTWEMT